MKPVELGRKYDAIARWWHQQHQHSNYGVKQFERALSMLSHAGRALDVGCGAGGRLVRLMEQKGLAITGLDVSAEMIALARQNHPEQCFLHQDICTWQSTAQFDLIVAWDSLFHLPLAQQEPVLTKLCQTLAPQGILIYTFGNDTGEHTDRWHNDSFYYSSIGINQNIQCLMAQGLTPMHLELDQYPQPHVYVIARRTDTAATRA